MTQKSKMRSLSVSVALLTSAASSSTPASISATTTTSTVSLPNRRYPRPLAFATNHVHGRRFQPLPSQRIRKRALARSFLRAVPTADNKSEFTQRNHRRFNNNNNDNNYNNNNSQDPRQMEELSSPEIVHSLTNIDIHSKSNRVSPTSALGMVVDSQREFEINLGRAIDSLKNDYPKILSRNPDFRLYHDDLEVVDPTGVSLHGLANYKRAFAFIHGVVGLFYDEGKSGLTSIRVGYDWARKCIRCVLLNSPSVYVCHVCAHFISRVFTPSLIFRQSQLERGTRPPPPRHAQHAPCRRHLGILPRPRHRTHQPAPRLPPRLQRRPRPSRQRHLPRPRRDQSHRPRVDSRLLQGTRGRRMDQASLPNVEPPDPTLSRHVLLLSLRRPLRTGNVPRRPPNLPLQPRLRPPPIRRRRPPTQKRLPPKIRKTPPHTRGIHQNRR
mmetsp:Transcript_15387/g.30859  ORF Transcript_15387/g.30859 Transcript_15387/m.30859 type:complete len:440 (-) Transcript_15387:795-2114(-)